MSWDQPAYSFGNPNAQPPTPTQTPTSAHFPSPTFETPRNRSSFENRSGWTPTFAEEYSVFDTTPGRLTGHHQSFVDISTPQPATTPVLNKGLAIIDGTAGLPGNISPAIGGPSNEQPSSVSASRRFDDNTKQKVTPRKPRKRLEEAFSGQTATPPQSSSKGSRKLAPKISTSAMQNDSNDGQYGTSGTPSQHPDILSFPSTSADIFGYPMSAPATAPIFDSSGAFLDPDTSMSGMDFDFMTDESGIFNTGSHRISSSLDWGRDNQLFQETVNATSNQSSTTPTKRQRPLAPKAPISGAGPSARLTSFDFNSNKNDGQISGSGDPFSTSGSGAVDPGLLFSEHNQASSPTTQPATGHVPQQPYEHQLRESRRDQEELHRSRSSHESSSGHRLDRGTMSSPIKGHGRPPLLRSVSDMRGRKGPDRLLSRGQSSPIRRQRPSSLTAIPESLVLRPRTEMIFTIDAKGKARTETVVVSEASKSAKTSSSSSSRKEEWESSQYESSSDDEPIIVGSRNTSFTLPAQSKGPKLAHFEISNHSGDARRQSTAANSYSRSESSSQHSLHLDELESEAETVMEEDDGSGDATLELRKVMENRKKQQLKGRSSRHHRYASGVSPRGGVQYVNYGSSTNISPTTVTDPDAATPTSSGNGATRCVCNNTDSEGFMIQCESCDNWLHGQCINIDRLSLPPVYICAFCAQTPNMRGGRMREASRGTAHPASSPLAHKSFKSFR